MHQVHIPPANEGLHLLLKPRQTQHGLHIVTRLLVLWFSCHLLPNIRPRPLRIHLVAPVIRHAHEAEHFLGPILSTELQQFLLDPVFLQAASQHSRLDLGPVPPNRSSVGDRFPEVRIS